MRTYITLLTLLFLLGCAQSGLTPRDPASPYYAPPAGSKIELKRPITVPAGATRVFLQRGELVQGMHFDRYLPSCNFEVRELSEQPQTIEPETFLVVRVQREEAEVVTRPGPPVQVASNSDDGGLPMVTESIHLWLGSSQQPGLMRLTCRGAFDDVWRAYPPSIDEIRTALGDYAGIVLP